MTAKVAFITGITGQDGAYLAEFLLEKGYTVHGLKRRSSLFNTGRIDHLYQDPHQQSRRFILHHGDMTDSLSLLRIIQGIQPDEIYNLAAQSHVAVSFEEPEYTANSDALGALRVLEAIRILGLEAKTRFYQASTSELYGLVRESPQNEKTTVLSAQPIRRGEALCLLDHGELPRGLRRARQQRHPLQPRIAGARRTFVTRKITRALARIKLGLQDCLYLGNLDAKRDWGHARDYVEAMWLMLQQDKPDDYVIATGQQKSVRDFVNAAAAELGLEFSWQGAGVEEKALDAGGACRIAIDPRYYRPTEVQALLGDGTKARERLGWTARTGFDELVREMVREDLKDAQRDELVKKHGYTVCDYNE